MKFKSLSGWKGNKYGYLINCRLDILAPLGGGWHMQVIHYSANSMPDVRGHTWIQQHPPSGCPEKLVFPISCSYLSASGFLIQSCFLIWFFPWRLLGSIFSSVTQRKCTEYWNLWHKAWRHRLGLVPAILKQIGGINEVLADAGGPGGRGSSSWEGMSPLPHSALSCCFLFPSLLTMTPVLLNTHLAEIVSRPQL